MARYDYWVHGVAVITQHPERVRTEEHNAGGTIVRQSVQHPFSDNWFHLPIPTPTVLDDDRWPKIRHAWLRAILNEKARIVELRVTLTNSAGFQTLGQDMVDLRGPNVEYTIDTPDYPTSGPVTVSVRVEFESGSPIGEVTFLGAGARFDE